MLVRSGWSRAARRGGIVAAASIAVVASFVVATAGPAWAHYAELSGHTTCSDAAHVVTWTIGNSEHHRTMHIESATARLGTHTYAVTGYSTYVGGNGTTSASTTLPTGSSGSVTLTVHVTWTDNYTATDSTSVKLISGCSPSTTKATTTTTKSTTTTVAPTTTTTATTTTTVAPTTTTSEATTTTTDEVTTTTGGETSTTEAPTTVATSTTEAPTTVTTTPIVTLGSTGSTTSTTASSTPTQVTTAANPPGSLPFTGGSDAGPMFGLASLAAGALALAVAGRRNRHRTT